MFDPRILAHYIRIVPEEVSGDACARFELYGCCSKNNSEQDIGKFTVPFRYISSPTASYVILGLSKLLFNRAKVYA